MQRAWQTGLLGEISLVGAHCKAMATAIRRVIVKCGVWPLGGDPRCCLPGSAVLEEDSGGELAGLVDAPDSLPPPLRAHPQFVGEGQHRRPAHAATRLVCPAPYGPKSGFYGVGRTEMHPVLGREVVGRQERFLILILGQALHRLGSRAS